MRKILAIVAALLLSSPAYAQTIGGGGGGGGGGSGTVTSIATGCQATGGTITSSGTISTQEVQNLQTGSNYAIVTGDCGSLDQLSNGSNQVPTIAEAGTTGFPSGWYVDVCNMGAGTQTITPGGGTIGAASTYVLAAGSAAAPQCVRLISDGVSNYDLIFPPGAAAATGANPSASAGPSAVNGSSANFMRADAAPAVQVGSSSQEGIVECDNVTIKCTTGTISRYAPALQTGSSTGNTLTGPDGYFICTSTCTVTPPVPVAGYQFCVMNDDNVSTVITLGALGSSAYYENTARTAYGTAGTGTLTSGGAKGDMICIVGRDGTHYLSPTYVGVWTAS